MSINEEAFIEGGFYRVNQSNWKSVQKL